MKAINENGIAVDPPEDIRKPLTRTMIRANEVMERTGKSRTTIWRDVRAGRFPPPVSTGPNSVAWFEDEVRAWQDGLDRIWTNAPGNN